MAVVETAHAVGCFGKLPSRGDFVRTADSHQLMVLLDRWAGAGVELLARDPDWKRLYDNAAPMHFAFLGSRSKAVIGGQLHPSQDASGRRFPFLGAARIEVTQPLAFIGRSPLALSRLWSSLARLARDAVQATDAAAPLRAIAETRVMASPDPQVYEAPFSDFLDLQDIASLQALLRGSGHPRLQLRWTLPALGLLMQPLVAAGPGRIDKALALPLPRDALYRPLVGAFWLDLIAGFLSRHDFELVLLVAEGGERGGPRLLVGFNGADGRVLQAALDPQVAPDHLIAVDDADWVEEQREGDYALARLVGYLERDDLALATARRMFNETFLGT